MSKEKETISVVDEVITPHISINLDAEDGLGGANSNYILL